VAQVGVAQVGLAHGVIDEPEKKWFASSVPEHMHELWDQPRWDCSGKADLLSVLSLTAGIELAAALPWRREAPN
jgi:hypothetical protein